MGILGMPAFHHPSPFGPRKSSSSARSLSCIVYITLVYMLLSSPTARAENGNERDFQAVPQVSSDRERPQPADPAGSDPKSPIRGWTWEGSFDRAGDSTRSLEVELKTNPAGVQCNPASLGQGTVSADELEKRIHACQKLQREAASWAGSAEQIRKEQRVFAEVSRVSDVAAVGAIGAAGYAHLGKASSGQEAALQSAAKIQETAAVASYAAGTTDLALGAYAYLQQKRKLEEIQNTIQKGQGGIGLSGGNSNISGKARAAAEQTTQAAYNHMLYGAGKVAVGYASMWAAKKNRQQAASMGSLPIVLPGQPAQQRAPANPQAQANNQGSGGSGDGGIRSNSPTIGGNISSITTATATKTNTGTVAATPTNSIGAGMGTSVLPDFGNRNPSSISKGAAPTGNAGGVTAAAAGAGGKEKEQEAPVPEETSGNSENPKDAFGNGFELASGGGGVPAYSGGKSGDSTSDPTNGIGNLLGNILGENKGSATGINPNQIYRDALAGLPDQSSESIGAEVSPSANSLFSTVTTKLRKMVELGRVQGPGAVEVRN
jgi:hypothetical protein